MCIEICQTVNFSFFLTKDDGWLCRHLLAELLLLSLKLVLTHVMQKNQSMMKPAEKEGKNVRLHYLSSEERACFPTLSRVAWLCNVRAAASLVYFCLSFCDPIVENDASGFEALHPPYQLVWSHVPQWEQPDGFTGLKDSARLVSISIVGTMQTAQSVHGPQSRQSRWRWPSSKFTQEPRQMGRKVSTCTSAFAPSLPVFVAQWKLGLCATSIFALVDI